METGLKLCREELVTPEKSARTLGSGLVDVYATPMMILLMENTASECVRPYLASGQATVGTKLCVDHSAATPIGGRVRCECELLEIDRRRLVFRVEAFDEAGLIGGGTHERFIVDTEKFLSRAQERAAGAAK